MLESAVEKCTSTENWFFWYGREYHWIGYYIIRKYQVWDTRKWLKTENGFLRYTKTEKMV